MKTAADYRIEKIQTINLAAGHWTRRPKPGAPRSNITHPKE